jgi:hypothetical protein
VNTPPKLLGKYRTTRFRIGDVVNCARRGDVRITGVSDSPIPWPIGQTLPRGKGRALVLYGDLAKAVRRESAEAVMHFWGVKHHTVWLWRKALGVPQYNEGTTALKSELLSPPLDEIRPPAINSMTSGGPKKLRTCGQTPGKLMDSLPDCRTDLAAHEVRRLRTFLIPQPANGGRERGGAGPASLPRHRCVT